MFYSFDELLEAEVASTIAPHSPVEELLSALRSIYLPPKESWVVVALELQLTTATE